MDPALEKMDPQLIRRIVREVIRELNGAPPVRSGRGAGNPNGPRVLAVFHGGTALAEEAVGQVRLIEPICSKLAVYTVESVRGRICGKDIREQAGVRCILDTVTLDGLEKVMQRSDWVLAPTFCLVTGSKVARLTADDPGSNIILKALAVNKPVLASNDGFQLLDGLVNQAIRSDIDHILEKLQTWGVTFSRTAELFDAFSRMNGPNPSPPASEPTPPEGLPLVSAREITNAFQEKQTKVYLKQGGIITPLARDLAREYAVEIIKVKS